MNGGPAPAEQATPPRAPRRSGARWVLGLALLVRMAVVVWAGPRIPPAADGVFYHTIGGRIAKGLGYTWLWPDRVITNAGHYPIGYPALVGLAYAVGGPHPAAAMALNALLGALAALAAWLADRAAGRRAAWIAGVLTALHPGLVLYTPALMTEGVTAALLACAVWAAAAAASPAPRATAGAAPSGEHRCRRVAHPEGRCGRRALGEHRRRGQRGSREPWRGCTARLASRGLVARAPRGRLSGWRPWCARSRWCSRRCWPGSRRGRGEASRGLRRRAGAALLGLAATLAVVAPWTARNCVQMKRCALVSHNGGWNLLIGADLNGNGAWSELKVPPECAHVYDEAEKDLCFGAAARRSIAEHPLPWLALTPRKLAATFDYSGAGGWYLHAANPQAFPDRAKVVMGGIEDGRRAPAPRARPVRRGARPARPPARP
ncbi:MAG: hypothetical protein R3F14_35725 [Polyangiaceae bacterium]